MCLSAARNLRAGCANCPSLPGQPVFVVAEQWLSKNSHLEFRRLQPATSGSPSWQSALQACRARGTPSGLLHTQLNLGEASQRVKRSTSAPSSPSSSIKIPHPSQCPRSTRYVLDTSPRSIDGVLASMQLESPSTKATARSIARTRNVQDGEVVMLYATMTPL